jgi:AhpD family alkylhydroperoxidase
MPRLNLAEAAPEAYQAFLAADRAIGKSPLDPVVRLLVKLRVSQINGCVLCVDMHAREAHEQGLGDDRLTQLVVWRESELFDERERAALDYAEAVTTRRPVTDEAWETVRKHFPTDAEAGNLAAQVSLINAFNLFCVPLHARPPRRG